MIRQSLSQKQLQKLSPRQIQLMKLMQIPTATLDQRIQEEIEANPALEEAEDFSTEEMNSLDEEGNDGAEEFEIDDYLQEYLEDDPATYKLKNNLSNRDDETHKSTNVVETNFHDYLRSQIALIGASTPRQQLISDQIIGSIDEDGYLRRNPQSISDDLMLNQNVIVSAKEIEEMLQKIQQLDPPGAGARNLQECLLIQIKNKLKAKNKLSNNDNWMLAQEIIDKYFDEFSKKHYSKLRKNLDLEGEQLKEVIDLIVSLNPKPSSGYANARSENRNYIIPDFFVRNEDGELILEVNGSNVPDLKINDQYKEMLINYSLHKNGSKLNRKDKEAVMFIKQKIDSAKWFIDAIQQRKNTMYNTMYTILQYQKEFFRTGDMAKLKPMILKDVAEVTGLDISTISRVANSKYVMTEFGNFHLKDFFSESVEKTNGEVVSTNEVKSKLKNIIEDESKVKPFSDEKLKSILLQDGYNIARRTVAKYREQLGIPVARLRKNIVLEG